VEAKRLGEIHIEKALIRLTRNDYEPDICFFGNEKAKEFTSDQKLFPPPDLVVEVLSPSTEKIDRGIKFHDYAAHGIAEYWIVDTNEKAVEQYVLREGRYELVLRSHQNDIHSDSVDGFVLPVPQIFEEQ
jgi:Uma2 family endonuclease